MLAAIMVITTITLSYLVHLHYLLVSSMYLRLQLNNYQCQS